MLKAYKYRIYPNKDQKQQIAKTFGCCRFVYNQTLVYHKDVYENKKKFEGRIKSATISQVPSGKYYVSVLVETNHPQMQHTDKKI